MDASSSFYGTFEKKHSDAEGSSSRRLSRKSKFAVIGSVLLLSMAVMVHVTVSYQHLEFDVLLSSALNKIKGGSVLEDAAATGTEGGIDDFLNFLPPDMRRLVNTTIDPCDDFHEWACGGFESSTPIPADKSSFAFSWDGDAKTITQELQELMENDQGKVGDYYAACMNTQLVEERGLIPAQPLLALVDSADDAEMLAIVVGKMHLAEVGNFFDWFLVTDDQEPSRELLMVDQGGLDLPDSSYYTSETPRNQKHMEVYQDYLKKLYGLYGIGESDAAVMVEDVIAVEKVLASHVNDDDDVKISPRYNISALETEFPNFKWRAYFASIGHSDIAMDYNQVAISCPKWLKVMDDLFATAPLNRLKTYVKSHLMFNVSPLLGRAFFAINLEVDSDLYGVSEHPKRQEKCVGATKAALPFLVSKMFVEKYFPLSAKAIATQMLENIRDAFQHDLETLSWMTDTSRAAALDKLKRIFFEVGYPSVWPEYHFEVGRETYFENSIRSSEWRSASKFERLRHPVMRHRWTMAPATVNAYYDNGVNGVFVPAGLLQPPFFDWRKPLSHNYGSAGAIMAHELTHGFDNSGRKYDAFSRKREWWDEKTVQEFEKRASCIATLYNDYKIVGSHVHGNGTEGENIADIGGLKTAHAAYLAEEMKINKAEPDLNHKRLFWTSFAQTWCSVDRNRVLKLNLLTDVHSPDKYRIIGPLSENPQFAQDFQCPVGSRMNPATRCELW